MQLTVLDSASIASGANNEDRIGHAASAAWVIDGATDVLDAPLTGAASDAAWFAEAMHGVLLREAAALPADLAELPTHLATQLARMFASAASRPPREQFEHPSASGIVIRHSAAGLDYVSVGDCSLVVREGLGLKRFGVTAKDAGDTALGAAIRAFQATAPQATAAQSRAHVWPRIRATRQRMNAEDGYGVFSITAPPPRFVKSGSIAAARGSVMLLASDGLMRLVDVYRETDAAGLMERIARKGMAAALADLRAVEAADPDGHRFPRAKATDDASGILLRLE